MTRFRTVMSGEDGYYVLEDGFMSWDSASEWCDDYESDSGLGDGQRLMIEPYNEEF